uniref:Ribonuclease H-like domain-containing protein n=1 Tax=Tanacetum cinerariifolium TaxID=118510 RepID=A0A699GJL9_TANCI|nr:ribonuclease H-like domain-containing protein [Tanacetum cinerariifolium]
MEHTCCCVEELANLDTMSMDDLYNNLKVYEPEVKGVSDSSSSTLNKAFVSSSNNNSSSTNGTVNTAQAVNNPNSPQLVHEYLEQIHPDDMEEMDLRWKMAMLTMKARRFLKRTGRKLIVNGNETISFDKSNVECYNCHKRRHFAREYRALRNQDNKHKKSTKRSVPMETFASTPLVSCDGLGGYDWSDQGEEGPNYALMAFSSLSSDLKGNPQMNLQDQRVIDSGCSRHMIGKMSYLIDYEEIDGEYVAFGGNPKGGKITRKCTIKTGSGPDWLFDINALTRTINYEPIVVDPNSSHDGGSKPLSDDGKKVDEDPRKENECNDQEKEDNVNSTNNVNTVSSTINAAGTNKDNELPFDPNMPALEDVSIFKFSNDDEDDGIVAYINNLDTTIQVSSIPTTRIPKDDPFDQVIRDFKFDTQTRKMSKNLEEHGKIKKEVYVCQPPEFEDPDFPNSIYKVEKALYELHQALRAWYETLPTYLLDNGFQRGKIDKTLFIKRHKGDILLVQAYVDDTSRNYIPTNRNYELHLFLTETVNIAHSGSTTSTKDQASTASYADDVIRECDGDDNQVNDKFKKGEGYHVIPPPYTGNYMPLKADLSYAGLDNYVFKSKVSEPITSVPKIETNAFKTSKDSLEKPKTVRSSAPLIEEWESDGEDLNVFTTKKVKKTVKPSLEKIEFVNARNATIENENKAEKPKKAATLVSASRRVNIAASKPNMNNALPKEYSYFKAHSPVRRSFNQKLAAKTNNFNEKVNTAKCNLQYALQDQGVFDSGSSRHMTGNKSYLTDYQEIDGGFIAFRANAKGDTECVVLSPDFKRLDESQVLLKVPRNNNMYSFDLKNVVPVGGLTCLFAKATLDESNLWHKRLGHINFKTMNKLMRGNLIRDLPSKLFENDHTCISCKKGKQHKASYKTKTNKIMNELCEMKVIRREFSVARTPQQNGVAEMKNKILIEAARTMLAGKHAIGTKWVYRNKKYERGIVVRNKARLVAQGYTQEEGINYDKVFALVAKIEAIRIYAQEVLDEFYREAYFLLRVAGSRHDIMFSVYACARFQVTPKVSHLYVVKRIFRYLKGQPKLGLWYPRDSPFDLEAFSDSDYAGASLDRKSAIEGCQFLVYTSCIEQFWATAKVKNVNVKEQIQALVDKNKVIITKASIRRDLRFEDEGGVDCLSNEVIFKQLTLMGYEKLSQKLTFYKAFFSPQWKFLIHTVFQCLSAKTTAWNEFSSTMAFAIICPATNQKFNFSKYIFDNMVKHLDGGVKFLMYPRFVQVFLDNQVKGIDRHTVIFIISSHTKKVFANMKREGKDFSRKVTPLFATMMVQAPEDMSEGLEIPTDPHHIPVVTKPSSSPSQKKQKSKRKQRKEIEVPSPSSEIPNEEGVPTTSYDPLPSGLKRLKKVGLARRIESSTEASLGDQEDASKQGRMIDNIDQDIEITLVDDTQGRMNEEDITADPVTTAGEVVTDGIEVTTASTTLQISKDELTLAQTLIEIKAAKPKAIITAATIVTAVGTRPKEKMQEPSKTPSPKPIISSQKPSHAKDKGKGKWNQMCTYLKNIVDYKHNQLKNKSFKEIQMLFNNTMKWIEAFVPMDTELVKDSEKSAEGSDKAVEGSKKAEEGSSKRATNDDDVTIEATPLSSKSLTIVDYKIYKERRKSYFKIIRADGGRLMKDMYLNEVFGYISLIKTKLLIKKLEDSGGRLMKDMYLNEVFGYISLIKTKLLIKKLEDSGGKHQV